LPNFTVNSPYEPAGDQPAAIDSLVKSIESGNRYQTLLGVTGSGKTEAALAIAARWPHQEGFGVVLDVGANLECDANQLREFAVLGEAYYRALYKKKNPSIGLLNVGEVGSSRLELQSSTELGSAPAADNSLPMIWKAKGNSLKAGLICPVLSATCVTA